MKLNSLKQFGRGLGLGISLLACLFISGCGSSENPTTTLPDANPTTPPAPVDADVLWDRAQWDISSSKWHEAKESIQRWNNAQWQ